VVSSSVKWKEETFGEVFTVTIADYYIFFNFTLPVLLVMAAT